MTRQEREANPEESFDGGYHLYAEERYRERVAKNPDRIQYAIQQFEKHGIEYKLLNEETGHFHCRRKCDDRLFQFWAGTGKILGYDNRGIHLLMRELLKGDNSQMSKYRTDTSLLLDDKFNFEDSQIVQKLRESDRLTEREKLAIQRLYRTYQHMVD